MAAQSNEIRRVLCASKRGEALYAMCKKAGFDVTLSDQIVTELWLKFILLATNSALTAATRTPIGVLRDASNQSLIPR